MFGKQLVQYAQRISDGSGTTLDASPLFTIPAMLLQHNKNTSKVSLCLSLDLLGPRSYFVLTSYLWKDLLQSLDMLVRVVLIRLQVDCKSTSHLLIATFGLRRKNQPPDSLSIINTIIPTFFEILSDGLLLKIRLRVTTLQSILEVDLGAHLVAISTDLTFFRL